MTAACSIPDFLAAWERHNGAPTLVAKDVGTTERAVYMRAKDLERKGYELTRRNAQREIMAGWTFQRRREIEIGDGTAIVISDAHYWPGLISTAHKAAVKLCKRLKPVAFIANGDIFDGGAIGRHDPFGWADRPTVVDELHACQERLGDFEKVLPRGCHRLWNIGNHDVRFERNLASKNPGYANVRGMRLADHFGSWDMGWSTAINPSAKRPVMVKHRKAGGIHAGYNNSLKSGWHIVTGHTHILSVTPWNDYGGRRWGVQGGTLADPSWPQMEYTEDDSGPACSGFVVLTFRNGKLLPPELCEVIDGEALFRNEVIA